MVAWELLAGERLFGKDAPVETLDRVLHQPIPRLDEVRSVVPQQVAAAVAGALERNRDERYATALDFEVALEASAQACGLQLHRSAVAEFLKTCCADEMERIGVLLRARVSCINNPGGPTAGEESGMVWIDPTQTEVDQASDIDPPTEPLPPVARQRPFDAS